jgi:hypothetical protein
VSGRARRVSGIVALVAGLALVVAFVVAVARRPGQPDVRLEGAPLSVTQTLSPGDARFADAVTASTRVFVDPTRVDPRSVRAATSFAPYVVAAQTRTIHRMGGLAVVDVVDRLRCLSAACVPVTPVRSFQFTPVRVSYRLGSRKVRLPASPWPALRVRGHVVNADLESPSFRVGRPDTVDLGYRMAPRLTGTVLLALAALAALAGAALVLRFALDRLRRRRARETPLRRILRELEAAASNGDTERRRLALDELALELGPRDESLAGASSVIAWARHDPDPETISTLAERVEELER